MAMAKAKVKVAVESKAPVEPQGKERSKIRYLQEGGDIETWDEMQAQRAAEQAVAHKQGR